MNLILWGISFALLGLLPAVGLALGFRWVRKNPEVSREYIVVPANDRVIRVVSPEIESRYEYRLSGVVVAGDNKPDHTFDFYLLHDMATLTMYEQGEEMPPKRYQHARRVKDWRTYMQTGPGLNFALVFVNPHPYELQIHVKLDYYPTPVILRGIPGRILVALAIAGMLISGVGVVMAVVGLSTLWLL